MGSFPHLFNADVAPVQHGFCPGSLAGYRSWISPSPLTSGLDHAHPSGRWLVFPALVAGSMAVTRLAGNGPVCPAMRQECFTY
jgi:hypothetical protein